MKAEKLIINGEEQQLFDWDYSSLNNLPTLWTAASKDVGTSAWNVPILDANWKLDSNIVPSTWVMTSYTVATKNDLTTLTTATKWDIWIVTSENKTYILSNDPYSTLANWTELLFPTGSVSSVNWFTWAVNLTTGYIQESGDNLFVSNTEKATWNNKLWANNVSTVALTGNYGDLNNKPVVDTALNNTSTNAVQNKAIATAVNTINTSISTINWNIQTIQWDITNIQGEISDIGDDKQDVLTPWTWISITNNEISNTWVTSVNWSTWAVSVNDVKKYNSWMVVASEWTVGYFTTDDSLEVQTSNGWETLMYKPSGWTTGQVLTKTANWTAWENPSSIILEWGSTWTFIRAAQQAGTKHAIDMGTNNTYTFQWVGWVKVSHRWGWACEINDVQMFYESHSWWSYNTKYPAMFITMGPWDKVKLYRPWSAWSCTYEVADFY